MTEVLIVGLIIALFFGAKRLPELVGSLGKSIGEFKRGVREESEGPAVSDEAPLSENSKSA